jgi:CheY-like chemotaxis protein
MNVLLVDDHTLFREGLALLLRPLVDELTTRQAGSCKEALQDLQEHGPADMVLMDLGLPGLPGRQGISTLRQQWPAMPVVALSSSDDRDTVLQAVDADADAGAMGFIPKERNIRRVDCRFEIDLGAWHLSASFGLCGRPTRCRPGATAVLSNPSRGAGRCDYSSCQLKCYFCR